MAMATNENLPSRGETSTEAYEDKMEAMSGACAADYWAGPGVNRPALDGKGVGVHHTSKKSLSSSKKELEKRVVKLEHALRRSEARESRKKKPAKPKKPVEKESLDDDDSATSSDSDSDSSSVGSRAASSSSSDRSRHASPDKKKKAAKKRTNYSRKHQLKGKVVKNADMLLVCLVKLLRRSYKKGKDVAGLIDHLLVMAEKTETGYYKLECLVGYDDDCREHANERGIKSFAEIKPATVLRFLSYNLTTAARKQAQAGQSIQFQGKKSGHKGFCYDFNSYVGCDNLWCNFRHTCMFCGSSSHGSTICKRGNASNGKSSKND